MDVKALLTRWIAALKTAPPAAARIGRQAWQLARAHKAYFLGGGAAIMAIGAVVIGFCCTPINRPIDLAGVTMTGPLPQLKDPRIVVSKAGHRLTVLDGDKPVKAYRVISGNNTADKAKEGDLCTPEGEFYVCMKNPQSKYVLSLGLSYPNLEDANRGLRDKLIDQAQYGRIVDAIAKHETPPWDTPLGGEIMIHGCATESDGKTWRSGTAGCVAMLDDDIRELFPAIPVGTVVEIRP
jgi:hypothetical protein